MDGSALHSESLSTNINQLPTPCLLLAMAALEQNEMKMRKLINSSNVALRPHFKAHKSSKLAAWHINKAQNSLVGFCAQTITEAELLVRGGASDILITNTLHIWDTGGL